MRSKMVSAGLLLFRLKCGGVEVLLGHPGGPYWVKKDEGAWTIPKGLVAESESPVKAAMREFAEEIGYRPGGEPFSLGEATQSGSKLIHVWALEGDWDPTLLKSNTFKMTWPPRSANMETFPELDRAEWFDINLARCKILKGQAVFIERLLKACSDAAA